MGWNAKERVAGGGFLDNFPGDVIAAGYTVGSLSADRSRSGKMQSTHQLFLLIQPRGVNEETQEPFNPQPAWFSMGNKDYTFTGEKFTIEYGDGKTQECYPAVADNSPALNENSKMGWLTERLDTLKYEYGGAEARTFMGIPAIWVREEYNPNKKQNISKDGEDKPKKKGQEIDPSEILLPAKLIEPLADSVTTKAAAPAVKAATATDTNAALGIFLLKNIDGMTDQEIQALAQDAETQARFPGLKMNMVYKAIKPLEKEGRVTQDMKTLKYTVA